MTASTLSGIVTLPSIQGLCIRVVIGLDPAGEHARRSWLLASFLLRSGAHVPTYAPLRSSRKPRQKPGLAGGQLRRRAVGCSAWGSPDVTFFPLDGGEVAVTAVAGDGDDAAAALLFVEFFGDFDGGEDIGARRMAD